MTTPTNEEVRRQFEAAMRELWGGAFDPARQSMAPYPYKGNEERLAWIGYQAALRSPAVVALVEALQTIAAIRWQDAATNGCAKDAANTAKAALAPFTTGAGHE